MGAIGVSIASINTSRKTARGTRFETEYGSALREELRSFDKLLLAFRAYLYPSAKNLEELRIELEAFRVELEQGSYKVAALLAELDLTKSQKQSDWVSSFVAHTEKAELCIQSAYHQSVSSLEAFRLKVREGQQSYKEGVSVTRAKLDAARDAA